MSSPLAMGVAPALQAPGSRAVRLAVLSDTHLSPAGTPEGVWNNATRRSCAGETLRAALAEIVALRRLLVLGDISDDGSPEMIACALSLGGPRHHDAARRADAIDAAAGPIGACTVLYRASQRPGPGPVLAGAGLQSADGGQTCTAAHLPDVAGRADDLLLWAGHYSRPASRRDCAWQACATPATC